MRRNISSFLTFSSLHLLKIISLAAILVPPQLGLGRVDYGKGLCFTSGPACFLLERYREILSSFKAEGVFLWWLSRQLPSTRVSEALYISESLPTQKACYSWTLQGRVPFKMIQLSSLPLLHLGDRKIWTSLLCVGYSFIIRAYIAKLLLLNFSGIGLVPVSV